MRTVWRAFPYMKRSPATPPLKDDIASRSPLQYSGPENAGFIVPSATVPRAQDEENESFQESSNSQTPLSNLHISVATRDAPERNTRSDTPPYNEPTLVEDTHISEPDNSKKNTSETHYVQSIENLDNHIETEKQTRQKPEPTIQAFCSLRKHRRKMSYHWLRFREEFTYVKQDRNDMANVIAILQQELQSALSKLPPEDCIKLHELGQDIQQRNLDLAKSEAQLDTIQDTMLEEEELLRNAEEHMGSTMKLDDFSDDQGIDEDLFGDDINILGASAKNSEPDEEEPPLHTGSDDYTPLLITNLPIMEKLSHENLGHVNRSLLSDAIDGARIVTQPIAQHTRAKLANPKLLDEDSNVVKPLKDESQTLRVGWHFREAEDDWQFLDASVILTEAFMSEDDQLQASQQLIDKRTWDLRDILRLHHRRQDLLNTGAHDNNDNQLQDAYASILNRYLQGIKSSWLQFSRFCWWLEEFWKGYQQVEKLTFLEFDQLLHKVLFEEAGDTLKCQTHHTTRTSVATHISSIRQQIQIYKSSSLQPMFTVTRLSSRQSDKRKVQSSPPLGSHDDNNDDNKIRNSLDIIYPPTSRGRASDRFPSSQLIRAKSAP